MVTGNVGIFLPGLVLWLPATSTAAVGPLGISDMTLAMSLPRLAMPEAAGRFGR